MRVVMGTGAMKEFMKALQKEHFNEEQFDKDVKEISKKLHEKSKKKK